MNKNQILGKKLPPLQIPTDPMARQFLAHMIMRNKTQGPTEAQLDLNRIEKILPSEMFISVGPGEIEGQYYACVMAPVESTDEYKIIAKCNYGFETEGQAKQDAARQYPSLPVLSGPDEYQYPYYNMRKMRILLEAKGKRERKAQKLAGNIEKSKRPPNITALSHKEWRKEYYGEFLTQSLEGGWDRRGDGLDAAYDEVLDRDTEVIQNDD